MYKTLGFKWLFGTFCPAPAFLTADSDEARNPQRFIHVTVVHKPTKEKPAARKSTFGFSNRISQRSKPKELSLPHRHQKK